MLTYDDFIRDNLAQIQSLPRGKDTLTQTFQSSLLKRSGTWAEFGVASGNTLTRLVAEKGEARVWGFDSFRGLPEFWRDHLTVGAFEQASAPLIPGALLMVGLFQDTLPAWKPIKPVSFVHIDCDIYSATKCAFEHLNPLLDDGAIIAFDELFGYDGFEQHEFKALYEMYLMGWRWNWLFNFGVDDPMIEGPDKAVLRLT